MSAKQGPTELTYPVRMATGSAGKPMRIPKVIKMVVMAKAGNHPEYMAAMPTSTMATREEKADQSTQTTDRAGDIWEKMPVSAPRITAPPTYRPSARARLFLAESWDTVTWIFCSEADLCPLTTVTTDWIRATMPAPIITPEGMLVAPRSKPKSWVEKPRRTRPTPRPVIATMLAMNTMPMPATGSLK